MSKFTRKEIEAAMGAVKLIVERHGNPKKVPKKVWTEHEIKISADIPTDPDDKESGRSQVIPVGCIKEYNEINCGYVWTL